MSTPPSYHVAAAAQQFDHGGKLFLFQTDQWMADKAVPADTRKTKILEFIKQLQAKADSVA